MNATLAPNIVGHRILKVLHWIFAIITICYLVMGVCGLAVILPLQPNIFGCITSIIALLDLTLGLYWLMSWLACWILGWFSIGVIQAAVWRNIRIEVASVISFLVGISCITGAVTWIIER